MRRKYEFHALRFSSRTNKEKALSLFEKLSIRKVISSSISDVVGDLNVMFSKAQAILKSSNIYI